ncbi:MULTISPECIES: DUF4225 domain-containing protein [unclassified Pseudomonas]|uniref:DUF4225 domain-containing protein n=1 Tax=unclassified Pseudomonas TaxID=196821 RepID=UPI00385814E9
MKDEAQCSLEDLNQAAEELIALGCAAGAMHIHDGVARLGFLGEVSAFVDEVVEEVKEGVISAAEGVAVFWEEQRELRSQVFFYGANGITIVGGAAQVELGVAITGASYGIGTPFGAMLVAHGTNNIYEGVGNIINGPNNQGPVIGPVRYLYQQRSNSVYEGNMAYGAVDLMLSGGGLVRAIRKKESLQLFIQDSINYEMAYKQAGKIALSFEGVVDALTIYSMNRETDSR